jgi:hypothetical protein
VRCDCEHSKLYRLFFFFIRSAKCSPCHCSLYSMPEAPIAAILNQPHTGSRTVSKLATDSSHMLGTQLRRRTVKATPINSQPTRHMVLVVLGTKRSSRLLVVMVMLRWRKQNRNRATGISRRMEGEDMGALQRLKSQSLRTGRQRLRLTVRSTTTTSARVSHNGTNQLGCRKEGESTAYKCCCCWLLIRRYCSLLRVSACCLQAHESVAVFV